MQLFITWVHKYERHLSALAMVAGFVVDNIFFWRIDLLQTQILFAGYTLACFIFIPFLHWTEILSMHRGIEPPRWRIIFRLIIQFALGGFWSAFVIFYGRSADLGASWPFLLFVFCIFLASEYFHQYHSRLVFTSVLFFFALYSYMIFAVPIWIGSIGTTIFLLSGAAAIALFALFTMLLRALAQDRFRESVWRIRVGAFIVVVVMNVFYFTNVLPPLPLSGEAAGIYHKVWRVPGAYLAEGEINQSWQVRYLGFSQILHIIHNESLFAYSSIFAPTALTTVIVHRWQWYDPMKKQWVTKATILYPIAGGRDGGYRGYSSIPIPSAGQWRVNVETVDGRLITRLLFTVAIMSVPPIVTTVTLQ